MKIKITLVLLISLLSLGKALAQDTTEAKIREIYLGFTSFNPANIQIQYKEQIGARTLFKLGLINLLYSRSEDKQSANYLSATTSNYSAGALVGIEFRKNLFKKFTFYHGPNLSFILNTSETRVLDLNAHTTVTRNGRYTAAVPYTLGFLFKMTTHFFLSAELNPAASYSGLTNSAQHHMFTVGLSSNSGLLSLVYRL